MKYRKFTVLQGVKINDKHIEVIVSTMMQKVEITDPGDTMYLEGDKVDRFEVNTQNDELIGKFVVITQVGAKLKRVRFWIVVRFVKLITN